MFKKSGAFLLAFFTVSTFQNCSPMAPGASFSSTSSSSSEQKAAMPYDMAVFTDKNQMQIQVNLQTGQATANSCTGDVCFAAFCQLPAVQAQFQALLKGNSICIHHKTLPANTGCEEVAALGFVRLLDSSVSQPIGTVDLNASVALGADAPPAAGECHSDYVLCDATAEAAIEAAVAALENTTFPSCYGN